jgi:hypothetical protein
MRRENSRSQDLDHLLNETVDSLVDHIDHRHSETIQTILKRQEIQFYRIASAFGSFLHSNVLVLLFLLYLSLSIYSLTEHENILRMSEQLLSANNDALTSPNGFYRLVQQSDSNLILYDLKEGKPLWTPGLLSIHRTLMQSDGNLVSYGQDGKALWASGTDGNQGAILVLQDDGNLLIYRDQRVLWVALKNILTANEQLLSVRESLKSSNGLYALFQQSDSNLVLYDLKEGKALWSNGMVNKNVIKTVMQSDGNLVSYGQDGKGLWASGTAGNPGAILVLQDDGTLLIYRDQRVLWSVR